MEYYAQIRKIDGEHFVSFPDLPNVLTYGFTHEHALEMASEALNAILESEFDHGFDLIPACDYRGKMNHYPIAVLPHVALAYELKQGQKPNSKLPQATHSEES